MGIIQTLTEGGQIWTHRFRMFRQVMKITFFVCIFFCILTFVLWMLSIPEIYYQGTWYYIKAQVLSEYYSKIEVDSNFWEEVTRERYASDSVNLPIKRVLQVTLKYANFMENSSLKALQSSALLASVSVSLTLFFFFIRGRLSKSKQHVSGKKFTKAKILSWKLWITRKASKLSLGGVPLIKGSESQHMLITGGTGTGKTNCLHHLLKQLRQESKKTIIVDTTGVFVEKYFRPDKDILLNPFDSRGSPWHPWVDCHNPFDYADLAEAFIPQTTSEHENYWRQAAKTVFTSTLQKLSDTKKTSELNRWLLFEPLTNLCRLLQGTKAASHMDINSEKTASSVRSVTSTFVECLENLNDTSSPFSIRDWIADEKIDSWLFLHCTPQQRSSMRPIISAWISSAIRGLLGLKPNLNRQIWFIIDELPTLQKVKDIETLLAEGRKYGGCGVLSLQSPAQLESIYGRETTKTIIGNTLTKVIFAEQDPQIAQQISKSFGQREIKEYQEGISYGAHEARDGVHLSMHQKEKPTISPTQIQTLEKNQAFLKLPGNTPLVKIKLPLVTFIK